MIVIPNYTGRWSRHRIALGILWLVYGGCTLVAGQPTIAIALAFLPGWTQWLMAWPLQLPGLSALLPYMDVLVLLRIALALLTGVTLLGGRDRGRVVGILAAIAWLLKVHLFSVLGSYTLWVLLPEENPYQDPVE